MTQGADPKLLDALGRASSLELFQLQTIIERMLADPRRIIAVRTHMHLGQTVRFLDCKHPVNASCESKRKWSQAAGFQRWGSNSSTALALWVGSRSSTSLR